MGYCMIYAYTQMASCVFKAAAGFSESGDLRPMRELAGKGG